MAISSTSEAAFPSNSEGRIQPAMVISIPDVRTTHDIPTPMRVMATAHTVEAVILDARPTPREGGSSMIPLDFDVEYSYVSAACRTNGPVVGRSRNAGLNAQEDDPKVKREAHTPVVRGTGNLIIRRDSLKRREALLRGKEGSRRRQRWENDHLLHNPYFQPPAPTDWSPVPLRNPHQSKPIRYELAQLWDHPTFQHTTLRNKQCAEEGRFHIQRVQSLDDSPSGKMPRELKERLKKARGAIGLLKSLEEEVREFILEQEIALSVHAQANDISTPLSPRPPSPPSAEEEGKEEILFRPRKFRKKEVETKRIRNAAAVSPPPVKSFHHACPSDPSATFTRWLIHSIAKYYGLKSWSVTDRIDLGKGSVQEVRIAYVGIVERERKGERKRVIVAELGVEEQKTFRHGNRLPRPLWAML